MKNTPLPVYAQNEIPTYPVYCLFLASFIILLLSLLCPLFLELHISSHLKNGDIYNNHITEFFRKLNSRSNAFTAVIPGTNYCVRVCCICVWVCVCVSEQAYRVFSTLLYYALQLLYFHKLKFCDNPVKKSIGIAFPTALGHFVSLFHTLVTLAIFQTFSLLCLLWWYAISNLWCCYCKKVMTH